MSRIAALTGATGFVGRHVAEALAARGWRLRLLARRDPQLDFGPVPAEVVPGALSDRGALATLVAGADAVIHVAGAIKARDRAGFMAVNRDGTTALAAAVRSEAPAARVVLVSSLAARAPALSDYAASKAAGEAALAEAGIAAAVLRPGAVYGPGDRETLALFRAAAWPVQPLLGAPDARVALIHARDLAEATVAAVEADGSALWELSDARAEGWTWPEIAAAACAACGRPCRAVAAPAALLRAAGRAGDLVARLRIGPAPMLTGGKVREILHPDWSADPARRPPPALWRPRVALRDGFAETAAWYRAAGWLRDAARPRGDAA